MASELTVQAVHQGGMCFSTTAGSHTVCLDYPLGPGETGAGPTPLQMLLGSLAVCSGSTLVLVLGRMKQTVTGLQVTARGQRRDEHPTVLTEIALEFSLSGAGLDAGSVARALAIAEEQLCPVWAMLKGSTPVTASFNIEPAGA